MSRFKTNIKSSLNLIIACVLFCVVCNSCEAASKNKGKDPSATVKPLTIQTPKLDTTEQNPPASPEQPKEEPAAQNNEPAPTAQSDSYPTDDQGQRVFFPPPKLNEVPNSTQNQNQNWTPNQSTGFLPDQGYNPNQNMGQNPQFVPNQNMAPNQNFNPNQGYPQPHQALNPNGTLSGGVETSTQFQQGNPNFRPQQGQMMPPPTNMMPPPNYMQGQVNSLQYQMQKMQAQMAPFQAAAQQYQNNLNAGANQFNLRIDRPNWIPPNAYTNDTMMAPYHASNLFFWDKSAMPNRPQMVQLANSVTRYWRGFVPNPCFVLVEPLPAAPGNYVFTSRDPRAPRGWLQKTNQTSISGYPMYRYWLDNPF